MKKYRLKINGHEEYTTERRSNYYIVLFCKIILFRRRIRRFFKRTISDSKILFYLLIVLFILYSLFYCIERICFNDSKILSLSWKDYFIYIWHGKDVFITSIGTVFFINTGINIHKRKELLNKRFDICTNINRYFNDLLSALGYNDWVNAGTACFKEIIQRIPAIDNKSIDNIITIHKNSILLILQASYIVKETSSNSEYIDEGFMLRKINNIFVYNKTNNEKVEIIINSYIELYCYFHSIWDMDTRLDNIIYFIVGK